jgi:hypothetical protein
LKSGASTVSATPPQLGESALGGIEPGRFLLIACEGYIRKTTAQQVVGNAKRGTIFVKKSKEIQSPKEQIAAF